MLTYGGVGGGTYGGAGSVITGTFSGTGALTGGSITGTNVPYTPFKSGLPLVFVSGGTMGNNGALSALTTSLSRTVPKCYVLLPAGAIATSVPAAATWYYAEFSSSSAATVFNVVFDPTLNLPPAVPTVKTAFVTTGPGAFTGVTAETTALQYTIAAGAMGLYGQLRSYISVSCSNGANSKLMQLKFGGSVIASIDGNGSTAVFIRASTTNRAEMGRQIREGTAVVGNTNANIVPSDLQIDTTANVVVILTGTKVTSTENVIVEMVSFDLAA